MINKEELFGYVPPTAVRLCACSACQLDCPVCEPHVRPLTKNGILGWGYLRAKNFSKFIRDNPSVKLIELSQSGEIFLNPELGLILEDAYQKGVTLTALNGVNLNRVSDQMCEDLVRYQFKAMKVALDGADAQTYALYRKRGCFEDVINNIKKINFYKEKYKSQAPYLIWQFIPFSHNEHQILDALKMAKQLGMDFKIKLNGNPNYAPVKNKELVRRLTPHASATREEFRDKYDISVGLSCHELWTSPQINWDGLMTGCCANFFAGLGNVFEEGLEAVMTSKNYVEMKKVVLGLSKPDESIGCSNCSVYLSQHPAHVRIRSTLKSLMTDRTHG